MHAECREPTEWTAPLGVYGKVRKVTITTWFEPVDDTMAVVHAVARHRVGDRLYGASHFILLEWSQIHPSAAFPEAESASWGERAAQALVETLPIDRWSGNRRWLKFITRFRDEQR